MGCISSTPTETHVHHHHHHEHSHSHSNSGGGHGTGAVVGAAAGGLAAGAVAGAVGNELIAHGDDGNGGGGGGGDGMEHAVNEYGDGEDIAPEDGDAAPTEDGAPPAEDGGEEGPPPEDGAPPPEDGGDEEQPPPEDMGEAVDMYGEAEPDDSDFNKRKDWDKGEMISVGLNNLSTLYAARKYKRYRNGRRRRRNGTYTQKIGEDSGSEIDDESTYEKFLNKDKIFEKRPFWRKSQKDRSKAELITIVSQCSLDRLKQLENMCLTWEGVISVSVYVPSNLNDADLSSLEELFNKSEELVDKYKSILDIHLLCCAIENGDGEDYDDDKSKVWYPINKLRNLALNNASTKYVFLLDIDFIPSKNLQENILNTLTNREYNNDFGSSKNGKFALVIPAFEYNKDVSIVENINDYPINSKKELINEYLNKNATAFHMAKFKRGHFPTNYSKWVNLNSNSNNNNKDYYETQYQLYYEPYVIVENNSNLRRYDERFNGYGFNKIVHLGGLAIADGYKFYVLNNGFVLSPLHKLSKDFIKTYRNENLLMRKQRKKHISKIATMAFNEMYEEANARQQVMVA